MIFVFVEDGSLEIVKDVAEAQKNYEGVDVESEVFIFFDEKGCCLKPVFSKPSQEKKILGLFSIIESGTV